MNLYDLLSGYNIAAIERSFESIYFYPSVVHEPYKVFNSTVSLTKNITSSVSLCKYNEHIMFFDMWNNDLVHVIFDSEDGGRVSLFDMNKFMEPDSGLVEYPTIEDIPDEDLVIARITRENLIDLKRIYDELVEMFKKDETAKNYLV